MSAECGFLLYVEHHYGSINSIGSPAREVLCERTRPAWEKLTEYEKEIWTNRAVELARLDPRRRYFDVSKDITSNGEYISRRRRKAEQRAEGFRCRPTFSTDDVVDEDEFFTGGQPVTTLKEGGDFLDQMFAEKFEVDREMVRQSIMNQTDGCIDKIKEVRFLIAAVQTFGNVDGICLMAEYAMNEFNLRDGVIDRFSTLVGPWQIPNEIQRQRAEFHANETHRIPLTISLTQMDKRQYHCVEFKLVTEILGRCEPDIARSQGISVGLYSEKVYPYILADEDGRRWIICLKQELRDMIAAMQHLARSLGLDYAGKCFPYQEHRYILADAFLFGLADCLQGEIIADARKWLSALGRHLPEEFATQWERGSELFCERHGLERNSCCATVTVCRANFIILHAIQQ
ncbi:hypothetical protein Angca_001207, partial [Angiostrongylus cantonensis]